MFSLSHYFGTEILKTRGKEAIFLSLSVGKKSSLEVPSGATLDTNSFSDSLPLKMTSLKAERNPDSSALCRCVDTPSPHTLPGAVWSESVEPCPESAHPEAQGHLPLPVHTA